MVYAQDGRLVEGRLAMERYLAAERVRHQAIFAEVESRGVGIVGMPAARIVELPANSGETVKKQI